MGWGDLGCTGSKHLKTPRIDELAASGVLCMQAYVTSPVCSPSRAGLITGRDPRRFGYEGNLNMAPDRYPTRPEFLGLPPGEHTLGDHLKNAGYRTGLVGKWHLGTGEGFHPNERGFDYFCGMLGGGATTTSPLRKSIRSSATANRSRISRAPTSPTSSPTTRCDGWRSCGDDRWFLFLSYNAPHTPMQAHRR